MSATDLIETFDRILDATTNLCDSLSRSNPKCWVNDYGNYPDCPDSLGKARHSIMDYWYRDQQQGRETRNTIGLVPVTTEQLEMVNKINELKLKFKSLTDKLKKEDLSFSEIRQQLNKRPNTIQSQLQFAGQSRIHLKQIWRQIPLLSDTPVRVGFNWYTSGRSINRTTVDAASKALNKLDTSALHIQTQLKVLGNLSPNTPLAKVQEQKPVMRANVFFSEDVSSSRIAFNCPLPIFYPCDGKSLPSHNTPENEPPEKRKRKVRSDSKISEEPLLPSIRVHTYS